MLVLLVTFGAQITLRSVLFRILKWLLPVAVALVFAVLAYFVVLQYELWAGGKDFTRFLLPPYQSMSFFYGYVTKRLVLSWLLALGAGFILAGLARILNQRFGRRFFEEEEPRLLALGIFLTGYPGFLFYLAFILAFGVLLTTYYSLRSKGRAPLYYLWLPTAIFVIMVKNLLIPASFWAQFGF